MSISESTPHRAPEAEAEVPSASSAGVPFNRRVHVVAEVLDRPEEHHLLQDLCERMGWPLRAPLQGETSVVTEESWTLRVVEVRIRGVRDTAVEQAVASLDALAQDVELSLHCRDAALVERVARPQIEWQLRGRRLPLKRQFVHALHLALKTGAHDARTGTLRLVRIPVVAEESARRRLARSRRSARRDLARHAMESRRLDAEAHEILQPSYTLRWHFAAFAGFILSATCVLMLGAGLWPAIGADDPRVGAPLVLVAGGYLAGGTRLALLHAATHRLLPWMIPLAVPLAVPLVPWLGSLVQRAHLAPFRVRAPGGPATWGQYQAGFWVLCVFATTALLPIAFKGWSTAVAPSLRARKEFFAWAPVVAMGVLLGAASSVLAVLVAAGAAGADHVSRAQRGKDIPEYFGVRARYACVQLVDPSAPYFGAKPAAGRALVFFGRSGDRVDLWNPASGRVSSVRLEDIRLDVVAHLSDGCEKSTLS